MNMRTGKRKRRMADKEPHPTKHATNPPDQKQHGPGNPNVESSGSRREIHTPESPAKKAKRGGDEKHALDYATAVFAFIAATATGAAAIFTGLQAWTAKDTETKQLRAYLLPVIDRESIDLDQNPLEWTYILKNFGQTPACHVRTSGQLAVEIPAWGLGEKPDVINHWGIEPNYCLGPQQEYRVLLKFSYTRPASLSDNEKDLIKWGAALYLFSHGTIYYDDIFGQPHVTDIRTFFGGNVAMRTGKMDWAPVGNGTH
jgi:hypothetical protein